MLSNEVLTIIGVNIALFAAAITLVLWALNKIDTDIKSSISRLDGHATRIDQLYHMFIDLVKENRK